VRSHPSTAPTGDDRWVITKRINQGQGGTEEVFDTNDSAYSVSNIDVNVGDEILLVYLQDADGDGLGYREELVNGTDPNDADTDNDTLTDYEEVRDYWVVSAINQKDANRYPSKVFSSPLSSDYDGDSVSDANEKTRGLDPYNQDTDGDDINDNVDFSTAGAPLSNNLIVRRINDGGSNVVNVSGGVSASEPQELANVNLDWGNGNSETWNGGTSRALNPANEEYATDGTFTITLDLEDDVTPSANSLTHTAKAVFTDSSRVSNEGGWDDGYYVSEHVRKVVDINQDGFDDIVLMGDDDIKILLGSASGPQAATTWSTEWKKVTFGEVERDPHFFVDIDNDGDLDIVGINSNDNHVRYGINNGSSFAEPVIWISDINWNETYDTAYLVDVDNNNYPDFVHAKRNGNLTVYTSNGASLGHSIAIVDPLAWGSAYPDRNNYPILAVDIDVDGCADLVLFGTNDTFTNRSQCDGTWGGWTHLDDGFNYSTGWRTEIHHRELTDLNNDGLPDLIGFANAVVFVRINTSQSGVLSFEPSQAWTNQYVANDGWALERTVSGRLRYNYHPRYLADVNGDGFKDIIGYANAGAYVAINNLGVSNSIGFDEHYLAGPDFTIISTGWYENHNSNSIRTGCNSVSDCREYFPRLVGDINGDGHTDLVGFDQTGIVYQPASYVTQFE